MKKSVVLFVLILSMTMSSQASAQFSFDTQPIYDSEEEVIFIVEMEDRPEKLKPLDTAKIFDTEAYGISR